MLKKSLIALIFIGVFALLLAAPLLFAQGEENQEKKEKAKFGFNMNLSIGLSSYVDSTGEQIAFQKYGIFPEFSYGKWGLGLDFTVELDGDFRLRDLDNDGKADRWSTFRDYLTRIYYLRYGQKGEPLYGRIGAITSYSLGHGLIMDGFSNTLFYPQLIQLGLNLDVDGRLFNFPLIGIETIVDDVLDWDIMGARLYARPLSALQIPIVKDLKVGATFVTDLDPQELPAEAPEDNPASKSVTEFGLDVELPIFERETMSLIAYADWAQIADAGSGSFIGSTYTYRWLKVLGQLRFFGKNFVPAYFDPYYERDRSVKYSSLDLYDAFYVGYLIGTDMSLFNALRFYFTWSDGFDDPEGPRIQTGASTLEGVFPKLGASLMYDKKDIDDFEEFFAEGDSLLTLQIFYKVSSVTRIVFTFERTYSPYSLGPSDRTTVETQFSF